MQQLFTKLVCGCVGGGDGYAQMFVDVDVSMDVLKWFGITCT